MVPTSYRCTSLLPHVKWPSHSWNTAFSKFDLDDGVMIIGTFQMLVLLYYRQKPTFIMKIQGQGHGRDQSSKHVPLPTHSHPFCSMLINPPIPKIQLFQNLTFKIQGQGYGRGQSAKPQSVSHFLSIHTPFIPFPANQPPPHPHFCDTAFFFQNLTFKFKIQGQGHGRDQSSQPQSVLCPIHPQPFRSMSIGPPIPVIIFFQYLTWKS